MSLRHRLTVGIMWMFAGVWTEQVLNLVMFVVIARLLGAEFFGLAMMAIVVISFAEFVVRDSIADSLMNLKQAESGHLDAVFWFLNTFAIGIILVLLLAADFISNIYAEPRVADLLRWLSPMVFLVAISGVPVAMLRRQLKFEFLAMRATIGVICGGVVGIAMATMEYGAWSLVGQRLVQYAVNTVIVWVVHPWRPGLRATMRHFRDIWDFGAKMVGVRTAEFFSFQVPAFVTAIFVGPIQFGYFTLAWRIVEILSIVLIVPVSFVAQPAFARLNAERTGSRDLLKDTTLAVALIAFPTFSGLAAVAPSVIMQVFGPGWEPAIPILRILCFAGFYISIMRLQHAFLLAMGRAGWIFAASCAEAFLGLAFVYAAGDYGLAVIAFAMTIRYYFIWPLNFYLIKRLVGIDFGHFVEPLRPVIGACIVMTASVLVWQYVIVHWNLGILALISEVVVGVATYAIFIRIVMFDELLRLKRTLRSADA